MVRWQSSKSWSIRLRGNGVRQQLLRRFLPISSPKLPKGVLSMDDSGHTRCIPPAHSQEKTTRKCNSVFESRWDPRLPCCEIGQKKLWLWATHYHKKSHHKESDLKMAQGCHTKPKPSCLFGYHGSKFNVAFYWRLGRNEAQLGFFCREVFGISPWWNNPRVYNCWTPNKYSNPAIYWRSSISFPTR